MIKNNSFFNNFIEKNKKKFRRIYGRTTNASFLVGLLPVLCMFVFFIIPLLIILKTSFSETIFGIPPFSDVFTWAQDHLLHISLNLHNFFVLFKDSYYKTAFINSLWLSTATTIACLVIGYMMAYAVYQLSDRKRSFVIILISLSFWTSILIRIYSWMNLLSNHGFINFLLLKMGIINTPIQFLGNYYAVCLGTVFCYLPFMIFPVYAVLEKIDKSCIEAASDLGANPFKTFWKVTIPLTKSGIIAGCILVFMTTMGEFVIPELLGATNAVTMGRVLWIEFFNNIDWPMACSLSVLLAVIIILPVFFFKGNRIRDEI